ncbi:MAG: alpha/beta fold hydrolase, partial [Alphaproteobacteria bacterium]
MRTITTARLASGLLHPYAIQGVGTLPLILLHGYTDSWRSFETVLDRLPPHMRAVAYSQRGHGDADRPDHAYRPEDFASDLKHFMNALGIDRAVIAGHSMGANVALRFAIDHPGRTAGLALLGGYASLAANPVIADLWDSGVALLSDPVDPAFARDFQASTLARPVARGFMDMVVAESLKVPARVWRATLRACIDSDFTDDLVRIAAPTLILWGNR